MIAKTGVLLLPALFFDLCGATRCLEMCAAVCLDAIMSLCVLAYNYAYYIRLAALNGQQTM
jgi:hypothetical protein